MQHHILLAHKLALLKLAAFCRNGSLNNTTNQINSHIISDAGRLSRRPDNKEPHTEKVVIIWSAPDVTFPATSGRPHTAVCGASCLFTITAGGALCDFKYNIALATPRRSSACKYSALTDKTWYPALFHNHLPPRPGTLGEKRRHFCLVSLCSVKVA